MTGLDDVTRLLEALNDGDRDAFDRLLPLVYKELHRIAEGQMRAECANHTFQPTVLIHEAYLKLVRQRDVIWKNRAQFLAVAAQAMRRILVDYARAKHRAKRGGAALKLMLQESYLRPYEKEVDLIALDEALERLAAASPSQAQIIQMRFFAGMTIEETATVLGVSESTVERDWRYARATLFRALRKGGP